MNTNYTLGLISVLLLSWWVTAKTIKNAHHIHLLDQPNHRSMHVLVTPRGGGVGIVIGMTPLGLWTIFTQPLIQSLYLVSLALGMIIALKGLVDDFRPLSAKIRFSIQTIVCIILVWALENLPLPPYSTIIDLTPTLLIPLVILASVWWINLFNFMDGIDGLAGTQAIFMLMAGALLIIKNDPALAETTTIQWMIILAAAILGFLLHNWAPARIFMGDVGSTFSAFMMLFLGLLTIRLGWLSYYTWLILGACFITDTTYTLLYRLFTRQKWWLPHRTHAYQQTAKRLGHAPTVLYILAINMVWLLPLAGLSVWYPSFNILYLVLAYLPLLLLVGQLKAGRPEDTCSLATHPKP